jgi:peroxiredoxin
MQRFSIFLLLALSATFCFQQRSLAQSPKSPKETAQAEKPKPEDVLRRMSDYLGKLPAFACRMEASLDIKAEKEDLFQQVTKMTARLERPNRLALIVDDGKMGMTVVSDGKQLTQYLPPLNRYAVSEVPATYAEMTDVGVRLKPTILGSQGSLIPTGGDDFYKSLIAGVISSKYIGAEKIGEVLCHHVQFIEKHLDWDVWIEDGKRPVVEKFVLDTSKQYPGEKVSITYTVKFSDWNVAPKFKDADFALKLPATAEKVDELIDPDPPHPLLGKPAPLFKTTDVNGHPFDLKNQVGKNVILLDFWQTTCGPCMMLMPELEELAKKFGDRGFVYRAVNAGEDTEMIKQFLAATKMQAPIVVDTEAEATRAYSVEGFPTTVLIGKDGKVQVVNAGYSESLSGEISRDIEALLAGKDLAAEELGKRKKGNKQPPK